MIMRRSSQQSALLAVACLVLALMAFTGGAAYAQAPDAPPPVEPSLGEGEALPYDPAEAYAIDRQLMCPVCPAQTIDQAHVALAQQMRRTVREMLAEGASRQEILDFFAERYGPDGLAAPPKSGFNLVAWVFPPVGVGAALVAGLLVLRFMSARRAASPADGPGADLAPYLEMVDRQLDLEPRPGPGAMDGHSFGRNGAAAGGSAYDPGDVEKRREDDLNAG
jgi:cytochrome c-type biogenesis protein CcmH